jgi:hypothetical protein
LAARHPEASPDAVEEAIQYACQSFVSEADDITEPVRSTPGFGPPPIAA